MTESKSRFSILAVVYDLEFIFAVRRVFEADAAVDVHVCRTSEEAGSYLRGVGVYEQRAIYPLPRLILFDTMTPDRAYDQLLDFLRNDREVEGIPVVLLTEVDHQDGVQTLLDLGANAIIAKRDSTNELLAIVKGIREMEDLKIARNLPPPVE